MAFSMAPSSPVASESRERLLSRLSEAAEVEHNLLCSYLYAAYSLKTAPDEGLSFAEADAVRRWYRTLLDVAIEEMTHLCLVANLAVAIGGAPRFERQNFPLPRGSLPADLIAELVPFDLATIDYFVYVERPDDAAVPFGASFQDPKAATREPQPVRPAPQANDYPTVGHIYKAIRRGLHGLCQHIQGGASAVFCGAAGLQLGPHDARLPGLLVIRDLPTAAAALDTIVRQGESATVAEGSHYARFSAIAAEYRELLAQNPGFVPARPAARNPALRLGSMTAPAAEGRVYVDDPRAVAYMNVANSIYLLMLRFLVQVYALPGRSAEGRRTLLGGVTGLMRALSPVAQRLTELPAGAAHPGVHAGPSFGQASGLMAVPPDIEHPLLIERSAEALRSLQALEDPRLESAAGELAGVLKALRAVPQESASATPAPALSLAPAMPQKPRAGAPAFGASLAPRAAPRGLPNGPGIVHVRGRRLSLSFEARRCIHARQCVTGLPGVFKANTPGEWLFPDQASPDRLATVAQACPSGALQYTRHDGGEEEQAPEVNLVHVRENGPLALRATLRIAGQPCGYRATLCRCGHSKNKPYCDGRHAPAGFVASGEPPSEDSAPLALRGGPLEVSAVLDGPLRLRGNLEICTGTGRQVTRVTEAHLCRCGHSKKKPFCDGSHAPAGFQADPVG